MKQVIPSPAKVVIISLLPLIAVALVASPAAASWNDWNCNLRCYWGALDGSPSDTACYFGVKPDATDGYDVVYDIRAPDKCPRVGDYVCAWFDRPGWTGTWVKQDYRSPIPEGTSKVWGTAALDTWNITTNLNSNDHSGVFDPCDPPLGIEYPIAASVYVTWAFGVAETPPYPAPPDDYTFTMQYKGVINAKPPGTKLADAVVPAPNQTWDMEAVPHIVIPLWSINFWPPDIMACDGMLVGSDMARFKFIVNNPDTIPECSITADPSGPPPSYPATYTFTATACCDEPFMFSWDFGDGATGTGNPVTHTYAYPGMYTVTCLVTDIDGDCGTCAWTNPTDPCLPPECCFSYAPALPSAGDLVYFTDCSTPQGLSWIIAWAWDFGDGGTDTTQNPTHNYDAPGTYEVCLTVTNDCGHSATCCQDISVAPACPAPVCCFTFTPLQPEPGEIVYFTDCSTQEPPHMIVAWAWDFGDGGTATGPNPTHIYADAGMYTPCLRVTNDCGGSASCCYIPPPLPIPPYCCFSGPAQVPPGQEACWEDCSTDVDGVIVSRQWSLDGSPVGTDPLFCRVFGIGEIGAHTLSLCVTDDDGLTACCSLEIIVSMGECLPELTADPPNPSVGETVTFTTTVSCCPAPPVTYDWDFDCDGSVDATTVDVNTATHVYTVPGDYLACVKVTDSLGQWCEAFRDVCVSAPPVCCFTFAPLHPEPGETVQFTDCSTQEPPHMIVAWAWDFGDGSASTEQNPTHQYPVAGTWIICLTVTNDCGQSTVCCYQTILDDCPPPDCCFSFAPASPTTADSVQFTDCSTPGAADCIIDGWAWDFGDGGTSSVQNPIHQYTAPGTYHVCLTATSAPSSATCCQDIAVVVPPPDCAFTRSPTADYVCERFDFDGSGSSDPDGVIVAWDWDFGDGAIGGGPTTSHRYLLPGVYTVTLTVTDDDGNTAQCWDSVVVYVGSDFDWNCNLRCYWGALDGWPRDVECFFGVKPGATDGYDLADTLKPPEPPFSYVYAWFYRPGWGAPYANVKEDWRSPIPEGASKVWGPGVADTWNVKTNLDNGPSGYFDPACDPGNELEYPIAASVYITWAYGVSEVPPGPVPPEHYIFNMQYKGGVNPKPPGTKLGDATVPAMNQTWDMEMTPHIVIPLWNEAFTPFTPECGLTGRDTARFKFIVYNLQTMPPLACWVTVAGDRECGSVLTFNANAVAEYGVASIAWDFGDGGTAAGDPVTHTYAAPGTYLAQCTVTDECGLTLVCDYSLAIAASTLSFSLTGPAWHMISLPCDIIDPDPAAVFDELRPPNQPLDLLTGNLHRYDPILMGYTTWWQAVPSPFGPLRIGEGYWLWAFDDVTINYEACCPPGEREIHFPVPGWYMIGNPCPHPVDIRSDRVLAEYGDSGPVPYYTVVPNWFGDPLIGYDSEWSSYCYVTIGTLYPDHAMRPFQGYWIDVHVAPSTLYIICSGETPP